MPFLPLKVIIYFGAEEEGIDKTREKINILSLRDVLQPCRAKVTLSRGTLCKKKAV